MQLTSSNFFLFIIVVIFTYYLVKKEHQWYVLLISSYAFYYLISPKTLLYLIITTVSTFTCGIVIDKARKSKNQINSSADENKNLIQKILSIKNIEAISVLIAFLINFGILAYFKYYGSFLNNIQILLDSFEAKSEIAGLNLVLPLGISFYTFQSFGYLVDVKRGRINSEKNVARFALFVSFFPQIIQGPISKFSVLAKQLYERHHFKFENLKFGSQLILWGYFKKFVIADRVALFVNSVFDNYHEFDGVYILIAALSYSIQIYCDFSGGIDIFRGIAEMMGITLSENFNRPFLAQSLEDYWRRWHITLGAWVREYVFYPLSLSKGLTKLGRTLRRVIGPYLGKLIPTLIAMIVTFLIIGIWHGPQWKYIAFGLYHGVIIIFEIVLKPVAQAFSNKFNVNEKSTGWRLFKIGLTFLLVSIGRYFVRGYGLLYALSMLKRTFTKFNFMTIFDIRNVDIGIDKKDAFVLLFSIAILIFIEIAQESGIMIRKKIQEQHALLRWLLFSILIIAIVIFGSYGLGYAEKEFIYRGF